jgi:hypothetical protein
MKIVILFGGGESGGLIVTEHGVRPIPPFEPAIRKSLKSAAAMVNAVGEAAQEATRQKMAKMATSLCNLAVEQVEEVVGPLDAERSLVFQDDDGGFTCGSNGKPPIPLPWPPGAMPSLPDLIAAGVIETDLLQLVKSAHEGKVPLKNVFENPAQVAKDLGVTVSEKTLKDLQVLAPSRLADLTDESDREIFQFFHKVVEDGRYLQTFFLRPYEVARTLKVKLSETALERLIMRGAPSSLINQLRPNMGNFIDSFIVCIVAAESIVGVAIAIAAASPTATIDDYIKDRSGKLKI